MQGMLVLFCMGVAYLVICAILMATAETHD